MKLPVMYAVAAAGTVACIAGGVLVYQELTKEPENLPEDAIVQDVQETEIEDAVLQEVQQAKDTTAWDDSFVPVEAPIGTDLPDELIVAQNTETPKAEAPIVETPKAENIVAKAVAEEAAVADENAGAVISEEVAYDSGDGYVDDSDDDDSDDDTIDETPGNADSDVAADASLPAYTVMERYVADESLTGPARDYWDTMDTVFEELADGRGMTKEEYVNSLVYVDFNESVFGWDIEDPTGGENGVYFGEFGLYSTTTGERLDSDLTFEVAEGSADVSYGDDGVLTISNADNAYIVITASDGSTTSVDFRG